MNELIFVANWKAIKTTTQTKTWIELAKPNLERITNATIVICPPFTSLELAKHLFENTNIKIGAQDVSKFKTGAYTGEVTVEILTSLVNYCIIGHSERRKFFGETDTDVVKKASYLLEYQITPILCVSNLNQLDSYLERGKIIVQKAEKIIFVYEPPSAISSGETFRPEDPDKAEEIIKKIKERIGRNVATLYGGSVNLDNYLTFLNKKTINGFLIGQASTNPQIFSKLVEESIRLFR